MRRLGGARDTAEDALLGDTSDASDSGGDVEVVEPGPELRVVASRARVGGSWDDGARVTVTRDGDGWDVGLAAGPAVALEAVEVEVALPMAEARAWLSNGFQSWSQSGVLALPAARPSDEDLATALGAKGDAEVLRDGVALSWWLTWVAGGTADGAESVVAAALAADRLAASVTVFRAGDDIHLILRSGGNGDALAVAADVAQPIERWLVASASGADGLSALLARVGERLPSRRDAVATAPEAGWNSWYELFATVDETDVRDNAARLGAVLGPSLPVDAPPLRIVVDDGWERGWGDWYPNDKFPSGLDGLATDLRADGFRMGVWLAPLLVAADGDIATAHPDWLVPEVTYHHLVEGDMRILDPFVPGAADHLKATAARLVGWGYDLLKIDFLFAGTFPGARAGGHSAMEAYVRALALIREGAGEGATLVAVGAPATPALPYVDLWRVGGDIAVDGVGPSFPFVMNEARSVAARWPFCRATLCDADPPLFRTLPDGEVAFGAWVAAVTGGALFLSDDLGTLAADWPARPGAALGPAVSGIGLSGRAAVPLDLVPPVGSDAPATLVSAIADHLGGTRTQLVPSRWRLPNGRS
ncbi:MAG: glycoside hydrolase family 36 protein [Myxococcota bacterium]